MAKAKTESIEVVSNGKTRRFRRGDETRPICPNCSTPDKPVLLSSSSRGYITYWKCPSDPPCGLTPVQTTNHEGIQTMQKRLAEMKTAGTPDTIEDIELDPTAT